MVGSRHHRIGVMLLATVLALSVVSPATGSGRTTGRPDTVRVATFNASLNRFNAGDLASDLSTPDDPQAQAIAEIIQRVRPDVLLINEFDYDPDAVDLFRDHYLEVSQNGAAPITYDHAFIAASNTGVAPDPPLDFDNNGSVGGPNDTFGFGFFPGQFGMLVLSRYPIHDVRTFQTFLWRDMPGALLPDDPATPEPADWYDAAELDVFRLSSKSHWDLAIDVGAAKPVHVLAAHPTPPVFDGPEDRNGRRNHDEIRFWADYVHPGRSSYIYDDEGGRGGLARGEPFVIVGDYNADPIDGDSVAGAASQLLGSPRVNDRFVPSSDGGAEDAIEDGGANLAHAGDPAHDTADFGEPPGNLRVDYVLPSRRLTVRGGGVFWPTRDDPFFDLVGNDRHGNQSSDHRLVWVDVKVPGRR